MSKKSKKNNLKFNFTKKALLGVIIVVVLVVLAICGGLLLRYIQSHSSSSGTAVPINVVDNPLPSVVADAGRLSTQGKSDEAHKILAEAIKKATDQELKYALIIEQGCVYMNQDKFDDAIASFKEAATIDPTYTAYNSIGMAAEAKGDRAVALENYRKALQVIDINRPMGVAEKGQLEAKIKELAK